MTSALLDSPARLPDRPVLDGSGALQELLTSAMHEARANGSTECPVCHTGLSSTRARGGRAATGEAECGSCGSRLI
jgi:hypothetical protein